MAEATDSQQRDDDAAPDAEARQARDVAVMDSHIAQLMEHFDSVQIIVTRFSPEESMSGKASRGDGNWYARFASVKEWVVQQEEQMRVDQRGD